MKLGIDILARTVGRLMPKRKKPPSNTWRSFLDNHLKDLVSIDFLVGPAATFRVLFVLMVLAHHRPGVVRFNVGTLSHHIDETLMFPRVSGALFGAFGLLLAVVGLYAVVNYSVRRRTREIGVRLAVGAQPRAVGAAIIRRGMGLVGVGLAIGMAVAFALSRFTASLLYGIVPADPVTYIGVPVILVAASLTALILPARRAARIEPLVALREE